MISATNELWSILSIWHRDHKFGELIDNTFSPVTGKDGEFGKSI